MLKRFPVPPIDQSRMEETIGQSKQILRQKQLESRTSFWDFVFIQFQFISKKVWVMQILIVLGIGLFMHIALSDSAEDKLQILMLASTAAPLLGLVGSQVIARSFTYNMMEIELSTKHSLEKLMIVRMLLLSMFDIVCLALLSSFFGIQLEREISLMLLYLLVPFNLTCLGCLWILNRVRNRDCGSYCLAFGGVFLLTQFVLSFNQSNKVYGTSTTGIWLVVLLISSVFIAIEVRKMRHISRRLELGSSFGL